MAYDDYDDDYYCDYDGNNNDVDYHGDDNDANYNDTNYNDDDDGNYCDYDDSNGDVDVFLFFSELCWGKAMVAYTKPQQRKKEQSDRLGGLPS